MHLAKSKLCECVCLCEYECAYVRAYKFVVSVYILQGMPFLSCYLKPLYIGACVLCSHGRVKLH